MKIRRVVVVSGVALVAAVALMAGSFRQGGSSSGRLEKALSNQGAPADCPAHPKGVGNCDPPPCPDPPPDDPAEREEWCGPASAGAPSHDHPYPPVHPPGPARLQRSTAVIEVDAKESDGRTIKFRSVVNLSSATNLGPDLRGTGTGPYRERFTSDQCPFTVTWTGDVGVTVVARVEEHEVNVAIGGPVTQHGEWPGESCLGGTYYAPNRDSTRLGYSCRFDNVNFERGGTYKGPPPEETPNPYGCTLDIEPPH